VFIKSLCIFCRINFSEAAISTTFITFSTGDGFNSKRSSLLHAASFILTVTRTLIRVEMPHSNVNVSFSLIPLEPIWCLRCSFA
jgi:hypothetical protein